MAQFPKKLSLKLEQRRQDNAFRVLSGDKNLIDFSSNDYLGLARRSREANEVGSFQSGATGSRLLTGNHTLYEELEEFLCSYHRSASALVFNSGYNANIGFFTSVPQRGDVVFYDELVHASIRDGINLGTAKSYKFKHNDLNDLGNKIEVSLRAPSKSIKREVYIATESVFSMDGDSPDLTALVKFCNENNYYLVVDEAHATGIFGEGRDLVCELVLEDNIFARIITFGKAMGNHGAAILGGTGLKEYLVNFARSLIYTTALPPHTLASVLSTYKFMEKEGPQQGKNLKEIIEYFKQQVRHLHLHGHFIPSNSSIHCLLLPGNENVKRASKQLEQEGFDVKPILSPTVTKGRERLRFCLHTYNSKEEISRVLSIIRNLV